MSFIVKMIDDMDHLLRAVGDSGRQPAYLQLQEDEWAEIKERLVFEGAPSCPPGDDTFHGVPVRFSDFPLPYTVGIVCQPRTEPSL